MTTLGAPVARAFPWTFPLLFLSGCSDSTGPESLDPGRFVALAADDWHTCALRGDGALFCWGSNGSGQLGLDGFDRERGVPARVQSPLEFGAVAAGQGHTCALTTDGEAYCWGEGSRGALGTGDEDSEYAPARVATDLRFSAIDVGSRRACALTADGEAWCWGSNDDGALGDGSQDEFASTPSRVEASVRFTSVTVGFRHTCGLDSDGGAWCWGTNQVGQLGAPTSETCEDAPCSRTPVAVAGDRRFKALSAGGGSTCGVEKSGDALCWGVGTGGVLGNGSHEHRSAPVPISGGLSLESVGAGVGQVCGTTADGAAWCWGRAHLGDGSRNESAVPVSVTLSEPVDAVSVASDHTCGLTRAGAVWCWGSNRFGQLGDGSPTLGSTIPVPVDAGEGGAP
jgi:alpha-tubulin suppressor-like RCC1 family protein